MYNINAKNMSITLSGLKTTHNMSELKIIEYVLFLDGLIAFT